MTTVQEVYDRAVRGLPEHEQVRLASFILWKCGHGGRVDFNTEWSDEDLRDVAAHSLGVFVDREQTTKDEPGAAVTG